MTIKYTMRYVDEGVAHHVKLWDTNAEYVLDINAEHFGALPEWTQRAVTVAKIGGVLELVAFPPPHSILWAKLDGNYDVVEFGYGEDDED